MGAFNDTRLIRWERATDTLHHYGPDDGLPFEAGTAFATDASGAVWIGFYSGELARWRDGAFEFFDHTDGLTRGMVNCLLVDSSGRLWVGAYGRRARRHRRPGGVETRLASHRTPATGSPARPSSASPRTASAASTPALSRGSTDSTRRPDGSTTSTPPSGLVNNMVSGAVAAPDGDLWFSTAGGVNRYRPTARTRRACHPRSSSTSHRGRQPISRCPCAG